MTGLSGLIPELQQAANALINLCASAGVQAKITSTLRTRSEQIRLYNRYLAGKSAYPAAPPGTSAHEFGYAFDMIVAGADNQNDLGTVWVSWGGVWHPSDNIHFEYPGFSPPKPYEPGYSGISPALESILGLFTTVEEVDVRPPGY